MTTRAALIGLLLIPLSLASSQKVHVDYEKGTDFSRFKTYAWVPGTSVINEKLDAYIKEDVAGILRSKGMTESDFSKADVLITYDAASDSDMAVGGALDPAYSASGGVPLPGQTIWSSSGSGAPATLVRKGTIAFRLLDKTANRAVWTGTAKATLTEKRYENLQLVDKAVNKIFERYPPKQ